jgi:hypothetical protein
MTNTMSAIFTGTKMRINVVRDYICFDKTRRDTQIRIYDDCLFSICVKNQISIFLQIYRIVILFTFLIIKERERERERERKRARSRNYELYFSIDVFVFKNQDESWRNHQIACPFCFFPLHSIHNVTKYYTHIE